MLLALLERDGIDTSLLVRRDDVQTSASVLPIRPDGARPAFHVVGANATYGPDDAPWDAIAAATHLHLGGPEFMGGEAAAKILARAREHGVVTSADMLAPGEQRPARLDRARARSTSTTCSPTTSRCWRSPATRDLEAGCRALLERGVGCVAATCGADGALIVDADGAERGAGVRDRRRRHHRLRRRLLRRLPARPLAGPRAAATPRGSAARRRRSSRRGSGTDHGDFDLAAAEALSGRSLDMSG